MAGTKNFILSFNILLFLLWASVQAYFLVKSGVKVSVDTSMYLEDSESVLAGVMPGQRSAWYLGYSSFLAVIFLLGGSLFQVVITQVVFSGLAAYSMYQYLKSISGSYVPAISGTFLYLAWIKIHEWNVFIYTESLFTSFCIITFTLLHFSKKRWHLLLLIPLVLFTILIRPTGFGFLFSLLVYIIVFLKKKYKVPKKNLLAAAVLLFAPALLLINKMLESYTLIESYAQAEIIYPGINLGVSPPAELVIPAENYPSLTRLVIFILYNPLYFLKIATIKFFLFFGNIKPYFSFLHNAAITLFLFPLYYLAVKGFYLFPGKAEERSFILTFILIQGLIVTLTTENWDGRFLIPVLPFIFILAAFGLQKPLIRIIHRNRNKPFSGI